MEIVKGVLVVIHLIGWALVLGGVLTRMSKPEITPGVWHGILTALISGLLIVGVAEMSDGDVNHMKIGIKLVVALVVGFLVWRGRKQDAVTTGYLGAIAGLTVLNVGIAVLW